MNDYSKVLKTEIEKRMSIKPLVFANGVDEIVKLVANKLTKTMKKDHLKYDSWLTMATMGIPFVIDEEMVELSMQDVFWGIIEHFADTKTDAVTMAVIFTKMKNHIYNIMNRRPMEDVYFFSNCLPCRIGYKNTHIHADRNVWWKRLVAFLTIGMYYWGLPYKSTIIVPISSTTSQDREYIEGFLCADSSKPFVFTKKYDLAIMQEMASVLYSMTNIINRKHLISKNTTNHG